MLDEYLLAICRLSALPPPLFELLPPRPVGPKLCWDTAFSLFITALPFVTARDIMFTKFLSALLFVDNSLLACSSLTVHFER